MMQQNRLTPDERFLIALFSLASKRGDPFQMVAIKEVASAIGQKEIAVKNIVKLLAQANFIQKSGDTAIRLTKHGLAFVENEIHLK